MADTEQVKEFSCPCGQVSIKVTGQPVSQGYCHCKDCQTYHQRDAFTFIVFPEANVEVVRGQDHVKTFHLQAEPGATHRTFCQECGHRLYNHLLPFSAKGINAKCFEGQIPFEPTFHIFYQYATAVSRAHYDNDGLPKLTSFTKQ